MNNDAGPDGSREADWTAFHFASRLRPPRELLRRVIASFEIEGRPPGVAVDLGCGAGPDTLELLRRGWTVHAVDQSAEALASLREQVPPDVQPRLQTRACRFEDFEWPRCDLVWSSWSLPYCPRSHWPAMWQSLLAALRPGGRVAGDLFGPRHAWAGADGLITFTEDEVRAMIAALDVEAFDTENGWRPSGGEMTRWHAFGVAARKP